jgi:hypothetical protein
MIRYGRGNLFDSGAQTLVNPVNCRGVMGKGLAKVFKDRWPEMFRRYQEACKKGEVRPGSPLLFKSDDRQILSVPTKDDWKKPSTDKNAHSRSGRHFFPRPSDAGCC